MAARARQLDDLNALKGVLEAFPGGASLEQIQAASPLAGSRRTLIRRLAALVERGDVEKTGLSRATKYVLAGEMATQAPTSSAPKQTDLFVPLSKEGASLMRAVSRPVQARKTVPYNRAFLESYVPNKTFYLSAAQRRQLAELGKAAPGNLPAGTYAQNILNRLLIDLSFNSSRLEGNTYSLLDTERLIDLGEEAEGKGAKDAQMILNHKEAIEFLVSSAGDVAFNRHTILNLHALLANGLLKDARAEGRLRRDAVGITQSVYLPPEVPQVIEECFDQILVTASVIRDPFEQSLFVMVQLPYLQPFDDVNKRVSRLAANIPLIKANLAPLSFVDVPDSTYVSGMLAVYELNRVELIRDVFLWAYERSAGRYAAVRQTIGEPDPFRLRHRLALKQVVADVIRGGMNKKQAAVHVSAYAARVPEADRPRFIEAAETELLALHEGNFARYQVTPKEFAAWQAVWNKKPAVKAKDKKER